MALDLWTAVNDYLDDLFLPPDPQIEGIIAASEAAGLPSIAVTPSEGMLLMLLARLRNARKILEIGTLGGYSTVWLARGLADGGTLISLEADPKHVEVARANITRAGLADRIDLRTGRASDTLAALVDEAAEPFDLIFIDADKESYPVYLSFALKLSGPRTVILADNVIRDGEILNVESGDPRVQGTRRFNELLAAEPRVQATVVQTVGRKGYDGFAIAVVRETK